MTNSTSHSDKAGVYYDSRSWVESQELSGVRYRLQRISMGRRIELATRIREIGRKLEFLDASSDVREKLEAMVLTAEIDRAYLVWGLEEIEGLLIDGEPATPVTLVEAGPMNLATEVLQRIKRECGLNEAERKN